MSYHRVPGVRQGALLGVVVVIVLALTPCSSGAQCPQAGGVILYRHANYDCGGEPAGSGHVLRTKTGFQNVPGPFNDQASSIKIPSGWSVRLYEHADAGGASVCLNRDENDFADNTFDGGLGLNDVVSSFEAFANSSCRPEYGIGRWHAEYFDDQTCWWDPDCVRSANYSEEFEGFIHKDWGDGSPDSVPSDYWSARFRGTFTFSGGSYVFHSDHDDGVQIFVDGTRVMNVDSVGNDYACPARYLLGSHELQVTFREDTGLARIYVRWSSDPAVCSQYKLFLPVVVKGYPPALVDNSGFESGDLSGWQHGGELGQRVVTDILRSGRYAALLGNPEAEPCQAPSGQAWIEQQLTVPASGTATLSVWHRLFTYDKNLNLDDTIDHLDVLLNGRTIERVANRSLPPRCDGLPHDLEWQRFVYDLSAYRGQTVRLRIVLSSTDRWWNSWAYVDDVSVDIE